VAAATVGVKPGRALHETMPERRTVAGELLGDARDIAEPADRSADGGHCQGVSPGGDPTGGVAHGEVAHGAKSVEDYATAGGSDDERPRRAAYRPLDCRLAWRGKKFWLSVVRPTGLIAAAAGNEPATTPAAMTIAIRAIRATAPASVPALPRNTFTGSGGADHGAGSQDGPAERSLLIDHLMCSPSARLRLCRVGPYPTTVWVCLPFQEVCHRWY